MRLARGRASLDLDAFGATIAEATLWAGDLPVRPFFQNPWRADPGDMDNLTRHLGGEWPCVPFGTTRPPDALPADWHCDTSGPQWHQQAHGFGAHSAWTLEQQDGQTALAEIAYPEAGPIAGLRRRVHLASETEIHLDLEIDARFDAKIPVGLHPVLSLADAAPQSAFLRVAGAQTAWTFPVEVEPGHSYLQPDQRNVPLSSLSRSDGTPIDARCLPFPAQSEDLVLLSAPGGLVSLVRPTCGGGVRPWGWA